MSLLTLDDVRAAAAVLAGDGRQVAGPLLDEVVTVSDEEIADTMRWAFERLKLVLEPSGASALAAVRAGRLHVAGRVGVTLSGGNVDLRHFGEIVASALASRARKG